MTKASHLSEALIIFSNRQFIAGISLRSAKNYSEIPKQI